MENKTSGGNSGKVAIVAAVITALAGIVTTALTISGPLIDRRLAIQTTQTREAVLAAAAAARVSGATVQIIDTPTIAVVEPAQTVTQTLPVAPTVTLAPLSTGGSQATNALPQATNTPADTMLRVGESWTNNGLSVKLTQIEFPAGDEVHLHFTFTNQTKKVMNIKLDHNANVTLTDDKSNAYKWATAFTWEVSIYPGTSRNDEVKRRGNVIQASYFIVKLEIPGLGTAQWRN